MSSRVWGRRPCSPFAFRLRMSPISNSLPQTEYSPYSSFIFIMTRLISREKKLHLLYICITEVCILKGWNGERERVLFSYIYKICISENFLWGSGFLSFFLWQHTDLLRSYLFQAFFQVLWSEPDKLPTRGVYFSVGWMLRYIAIHSS